MILLTSLQSSTMNAYAISVTSTSSPTDIANALLAGGGTGIDPTSVVVTISASPNAVGTYVNLSGTYGAGDGIVISSGDVNSYNDGLNTQTDFSTPYFVAETPAQKILLDPITTPLPHFDVAQIDIDFDMLPTYDTVYFNTVFGSEEYDEYVGSPFNDGFGLFVNGVNIAFVNSSPVNIDHPDMAFTPGTELDGILANSQDNFGPYVHTFSAPVNPTGNKLTFIVADSSDYVLDTTAYISSLGGSPPPAEICGDGEDNDNDGLTDEDCEVENQPPDCSTAAPQSIWPPNHKLRVINVQGVSDPDGDPLTYTINSIHQDEPTKSKEKGDKSPDGFGVGTDTANLRAERFGSSDGRVYDIGFTADDGQGESCTGTFTVQVPHDQRGTDAINSGTTFDSTIP